MNNQFISPLQVYSAKSWSGMTEYNSLSNIFANKPFELDAIMSSHFGFRYGQYLNLLTGGLGNTIVADDREIRWKLHGQNERAIEVLSTPETTTTPGLGGSTVRVVFAEQFFSHSDVLVADDGTQLRVTGSPEPANGGWLYRLQLPEGTSNSFIDPAQIQAGKKFSKDYSTVGEFSDKGGSTSYTSPMEIRNRMTTLRKEFSITGEAAATRLHIKLKSPDGKKDFDMWCPLAQMTALQQFYAEIDRSLIYSKYTGNIDDTVKDINGRPVLQGAGLRQQIAPANVRFYTRLSYNLLMDFFTDLSFVSSPMGDGTNKFVMLTGKMGMIEFSRAIETEFRGLGVTVTNEGRFLTGKGMELDFGKQFTTVRFPNGIEVTVAVFPPYDDIVRHRTVHPVSKKPVESYRFTVINIGKDGEGKSNICKVVRKGREMMMWHEGGSIDINGQAKSALSNQSSNALDGAIGHMLTECGLIVKDPTKCGELILNID